MSNFYCQLDYEHVPYLSPMGNGHGNISNNGCGVCSASMVVENMLGVSFPPEEAAKLAKMCGAREVFGTDFYTYAPVLAARWGLKVRDTEDAAEALRFLQEGRGMIVANVRGDRPDDGYIGVFSNGGHYVVIAEATSPDGTEVKVWDPMYREGSGRFDIPGRKGKVRMDGTDAYADFSVFHEDCYERPFFLFEKSETATPKPLIGVTGGPGSDERALVLFRNYMKAVLDAGGLPVAISPDASEDELRELISRLDGMLVTGGLDVDPSLYGMDKHPSMGETSLLRDAVEAACVRLCREMNKPVLGICRGLQIMVAALGGTLVQDIPTQKPSEINHFPCRTDWHIREAHTVSTVRGTRLEVIAGGTYSVNSYHHQAIDAIPEGMRVAAHAEDGLIEAVECCNGALCLGVQWHPERLYDADPNAAALFRALVDNARKTYA
ncbi:MAG: gamma-glutamyl-gamma-aminobutyrate hydrolase family protein [Clostridia bacterium]|nr:gamma-glutamyl-gamma-aminobutyrate hydrolase family protein [Clostridia bacterium]